MSFIEKQFPLSKVSKESYKRRRSGATQTLTKYRIKSINYILLILFDI